MLRRIKNLLFYIKVIRRIKDDLNKKFSMRVDAIYRLYTIFSILPKDYETYGDELFETELKKYIKDVDNYLADNGLQELYGLSTMERLDDLNYKIVIRFKYLNTLTLANILIFLFSLVMIGISLGLILIFFMNS